MVSATGLWHGAASAFSGLLPFALLLSGCAYYSLSGASLPKELSTVAVPLAEVAASAIPAGFDQQVTDALIARFVDQTRLQQVSSVANADAVVRATIEGYRVSPAAVTGEDVASLDRVTLSIRIEFLDRVTEEERMARVFTTTADYDPAAGLAGEAEAAERALSDLADEAFNAAASDW